MNVLPNLSVITPCITKSLSKNALLNGLKIWRDFNIRPFFNICVLAPSDELIFCRSQPTFIAGKARPWRLAVKIKKFMTRIYNMVGVSRTTLSVSIYMASRSSYFNFGHQFDKL
jgi:hypothetical protein